MDMDVPFAVHEGAAGVTQNSRETLVNMYAEVVQSGKDRIIRRQRPGVVSFYAIGGEKRCIEKFKNTHYCVIGSTFYKLVGSVLTSLGTLSTVSGKCTMIHNDNDEIMISDGATGYYWDGATLVTITPPAGMDGFGTLAYLGGFGIIAVPDSDRFYTTPLNDFSQVDALDFATAESAPDPIVRIFVDHNELWLAGENSTEVWQFLGGTDFPFSSLQNAKLERGCGAAYSYSAEDNTVFFLGDDNIVYRADGYRPAVTSSREIEDAIAKVSATEIANAHSFVYTSRGNKFYTLVFSNELTIQFNITTGLWARAATYNYDYWRIMGSNGHHADYFMTPAGIVTLVDGTNTDEGGIFQRKAISAPGFAMGHRMSIYEFWLDAEVGRADINTDADVMMRVALDGEQFRNERVRSLGATGKYTRRTVWRNLGQGRSPVVEVSITDPVEFTIMGAKANVTLDG